MGRWARRIFLAAARRLQAAIAFVADRSTGMPLLPSSEHVYCHHGTDYETAKILYVSDIAARGREEFGRGFYTHTNWQLAKNWAIRKAVTKRHRGWGVVTFAIPTGLWDSSLRSTLVFMDAKDLPANTPVNPGTGHKMDWMEFIEYNSGQYHNGRLLSWEEYNVIIGPMNSKKVYFKTAMQVMFTASGTPILNRANVRSMRMVVLKEFPRWVMIMVSIMHAAGSIIWRRIRRPNAIVAQISAALAVRPVVIRHPIGGNRWPVHIFELADKSGSFVFVEDGAFRLGPAGRGLRLGPGARGEPMHTDNPIHRIDGPGETIAPWRWRFPPPVDNPGCGPVIVEVLGPDDPQLHAALQVRAWLERIGAFSQAQRARVREIASLRDWLSD